MRRLPIFTALSASLFFACANEDPAPLFLDIDYQLRCIDCVPRAADEKRRNLAVLDAEDGFTVACAANPRAGDRLLSFSAYFTDPEGKESNDYSISVVQANLDAKDPGAGCRVSVAEGSNTYEGQCTGDAPTEEEPCQVKLVAEHGVVTGSLYCDNIPNLSTAMITRYLVKPNTRDPAKFTVEGCTGL